MTEQPETFAFTPENRANADAYIALSSTPTHPVGAPTAVPEGGASRRPARAEPIAPA